MKILLLSCLLLSASAIAIAADFNYAAYKDSSIAAAGSNLAIDPRTTYWLDAGYDKFHVIATYTGNIRAIQPTTHELIRIWSQGIQHDDEVAAMYISEIEVRENGTTYWLPIQQALVAPFRHEAVAGKPVQLYLLLFGAYKLVPVFGVSEFKAVEG